MFMVSATIARQSETAMHGDTSNAGERDKLHVPVRRPGTYSLADQVYCWQCIRGRCNSRCDEPHPATSFIQSSESVTVRTV